MFEGARVNAPTRADIDELIGRLATARTADDACNEYALDSPNNAIRRENLRLYLQTMVARMPDTLLLMEAPGYRGCRLTGVPVTSRKLLLQGVPELEIFGAERGFRDVDDSGFERVRGEQTATIVWCALAEMGVLPFIWNTFPFHPHKRGQPLTNRRPRAAEVKLGRRFLRNIIAIWGFQRIIAIGNVAHDSLTAAGYDCSKVRHPAQGGKRAFVAGLKDLLSA